MAPQDMQSSRANGTNNQNNEPSTIAQELSNYQSQEQEQKEQGTQGEYNHIASIIADLDRRLRMLEERYSNLRKKIQLSDQNIIESEKSFSKEIRSFNEDIIEMKRNIYDFNEKVSIFSGEIDNSAKKTDLKVIEKYLAMWNPKTFVTRKELREYLKTHNVEVIDEEENDESDT